MRNRRKLLVLLASVLVVGGTLMWFGTEKEPSYGRRNLSEWIAIHVDYDFEPTNAAPSQKQQAVDAIRHIGPNALPYLLLWIDYEPSPWRNRVEALAEKLPGWLRTSWPIKSLQLSDEEARRPYDAARAFAALGTLAAPAVPDLIRRIKETHSREKAGRAMMAMACIGPETAPKLISILSSLDQGWDVWSVDCITIMGTNARPLVPVLLQRLQSTNERIAFLSADILENFKLDSELVVPGLVKALKHPRFIVQFKAAVTLGEFGELARPALPALSNTLNDPHPDVRRAASNAILWITAEAVTNAPAQ